MRVTKQATDAAAINGVEIIYDSVIYHLLDAFKARKAKFLAARKIELLHPCILAIEPAYVIKEYGMIICLWKLCSRFARSAHSRCDCSTGPPRSWHSPVPL